MTYGVVSDVMVPLVFLCVCIAAHTVKIGADWDLSVAAWVVFIAVLCCLVLAAMFIALVSRFRNQRKDDGDWEEVREQRTKHKASNVSETVRPSAYNSQSAAAAEGTLNGNIGSQSSISPIVVAAEDPISVSPGNIALSASVPAIHTSSSTPVLTVHQPRRLSEASRLRGSSVSESQKAPSPIIWDKAPGSHASRLSDDVYGYSRLAERSGSAGKRETGDYDDVVQAQMRSHTVSTPRQSHHYDKAA